MCSEKEQSLVEEMEETVKFLDSKEKTSINYQNHTNIAKATIQGNSRILNALIK